MPHWLGPVRKIVGNKPPRQGAKGAAPRTDRVGTMPSLA